MLHNLMFHPNPRSRAEPIQMSRMTFQCHRRANQSNNIVALILVMTGACHLGLGFDVEREGDLPRDMNMPTLMPTANVTSVAPVGTDYRRSKRRGTVPAGLRRVVVTPT